MTVHLLMEYVVFLTGWSSKLIICRFLVLCKKKKRKGNCDYDVLNVPSDYPFTMISGLPLD